MRRAGPACRSFRRTVNSCAPAAAVTRGMQGAESPVWIGHVQPLRDAHRGARRRAPRHARG
jgi:hypothetical protein